MSKPAITWEYVSRLGLDDQALAELHKALQADGEYG
jgi:hypothetical protein